MYSEYRKWPLERFFLNDAYCISSMLPETPDWARLSLLLQPPGLRDLMLPKNLVLRLGDVDPAILWRSEKEVVEYALGSVELLSPILEDKILVGRRDD